MNTYNFTYLVIEYHIKDILDYVFNVSSTFNILLLLHLARNLYYNFSSLKMLEFLVTK